MSGMMTLAGDKEDPPNRPYGNQGYVCAGIDGGLYAGRLDCDVERAVLGQVLRIPWQSALPPARSVEATSAEPGGL